jgi:hypothetical protein
LAGLSTTYPSSEIHLRHILRPTSTTRRGLVRSPSSCSTCQPSHQPRILSIGDYNVPSEWQLARKTSNLWMSWAPLRLPTKSKQFYSIRIHPSRIQYTSGQQYNQYLRELRMCSAFTNPFPQCLFVLPTIFHSFIFSNHFSSSLSSEELAVTSPEYSMVAIGGVSGNDLHFRSVRTGASSSQ